MNPTFELDSRFRDDVAILSPKGYLNNLMGEKLEQSCNSLLAEGAHKIILDFSEVELINSIGISILLSILEHTAKSRHYLCFASLSPLLEETFQALDLSRHMRVFSSQDEAFIHLQGVHS